MDLTKMALAYGTVAVAYRSWSVFCHGQLGFICRGASPAHDITNRSRYDRRSLGTHRQQKYTLRRLRSVCRNGIGRDHTSIVRMTSAGIGVHIILIRSPPQRLNRDVSGPCRNMVLVRASLKLLATGILLTGRQHQIY